MRLVSMAAGGENEYYDFVSYVAKDKETGVRECHVFDCGDFADEVLTTLGQAFVLAADLKRSKPKKKARARESCARTTAPLTAAHITQRRAALSVCALDAPAECSRMPGVAPRGPPPPLATRPTRPT